MVFTGNNPRHRIVASQPNPQNSTTTRKNVTSVQKRSNYTARKPSNIASSNRSSAVIAGLIVFIVGVVKLVPWKSLLSPLSKSDPPTRGFPRIISVTESLDMTSKSIQLDYEFVDFTKPHKAVQWDKVKWDKKRARGPKPKGDSWFERHRVVLQDEDTGCPFIADWQKTNPNPTCNTVCYDTVCYVDSKSTFSRFLPVDTRDWNARNTNGKTGFVSIGFYQ